MTVAKSDGVSAEVLRQQLMNTIQLVSSSDLVTVRHDEVVVSSSVRYRTDELQTDLCSQCRHPIPGAHRYNCPTLENDPADLPDPFGED